MSLPTLSRPRRGAARQGPREGGRPSIPGAVLIAAAVALLLVLVIHADPPAHLTGSNAPWTDEGFDLGNARNLAVFGRFGTDDIDRSLTNGPFSAVTGLVFLIAGPSIVGGRLVSAACVTLAVLLFGLGLARPLGRRTALLAAAVLGSTQLVLEYGRLALLEPMVVLLLSAALVLAARVPLAPSRRAGVALGLALALAVWVKAIAVVPAAVLLGVPAIFALVRRDRAAGRMVLAAAGSSIVAAVAWFVLVAVPNLDRLRTALLVWGPVSYPATPAQVAHRLASYASHSDRALGLSAPLLAVAGLGLVMTLARWRRLPVATRHVAVLGGLWGAGTWLAIAAGSYAPNRYIVPALPGLAVLGGLGLGQLADLAPPRRRALVGGLLAVVLAAPGVAGFIGDARASWGELTKAQRIATAVVPDDAVVFGSYAPTLLFSTNVHAVTPWPNARANVADPAGRFGVRYLVCTGPGDPEVGLVAPAGLTGSVLLASVRYGPHQLEVYRLARS